MRGLVMLLLLASAASPSLARPNEDRDEARHRVDLRAAARAERRENRPARVERSEQRPARTESAAPTERPSRPDRPQGGNYMAEQVRAWGGAGRVSVPDRPQRTESVRVQRRSSDGGDATSSQPEPQRSTGDSVRNWRPRDREQGNATPGNATPARNQAGRGWTQQPRDGDIADRRFRRALDRRFGDRDGRLNDGRPYDGVWNEHVRDGLAVSTTPRPGTQPPLRADRKRRNWAGQWSRDWRDDRRFDWRGHRDRNRSIFRIGFYYDPFGWDYRRYNIGWRMWPNYYSRSHWLNDPWRYRLPPAYAGTQWIRYHGDAILVDTWTGEVIDVIHDFFW